MIYLLLEKQTFYIAYGDGNAKLCCCCCSFLSINGAHKNKQCVELSCCDLLYIQNFLQPLPECIQVE